MMLMLSLFWLLVGLLIGTLANAAKLRPAWVRGGRVGMLGLGALVALLGGWLGTLLLGTLFATATAIWITVLGVALLPWPLTWLRSRSSPTP
jgi:uncharacterized membrane protein YeaQ/YmgE (transglycosylase-associated protein family)